MLRILFFALLVKPFFILWVGLHVRGRQHLPCKGPAIIAANHNSHLDALALLSLYSLKDLKRVRAVAAADYFFTNPLLGFIATRLIGILPISRNGRDKPLAKINAALDAGEILIFFPEGTRGDPEVLGNFKSGLARLAEARKDLSVVPVYMTGFGKVLPRGSFLPVPFFCDIAIGGAMELATDRKTFLTHYQVRMEGLEAQMNSGAFL